MVTDLRRRGKDPRTNLKAKDEGESIDECQGRLSLSGRFDARYTFSDSKKKAFRVPIDG